MLGLKNSVLTLCGNDEQYVSKKMLKKFQEFIKTKNIFYLLINNTNKNLICFSLTFIFFIVSCFLVSCHEIWRDEGQAFLLIRESKNLYDLFLNISSEGHPFLWYAILFPIVHIFNDIYAVQVFHVLISSCTIFLIIRYAPFEKMVKILLVFSYFLFYEYNIFLRCYSLTVFIIFMFSILYIEKDRDWLSGVLLFFLANTSVMGLIFVIGVVLIEFVFSLYNTRKNYFQKKLTCLGSLGILVAILQITRAGVEKHIHFESMHKTGKAIFNSFFPFPNIELSFWQTNIFLENEITYTFFWAIFVILNVIFILRICDNLKLLFIYITTNLGYLSFFNYIYPCASCHCGFMFLLFIVVDWTYRCKKNAKQENCSVKYVVNYVFNIMLYFVLLIQFVGGCVSSAIDFKNEFSGSFSVANYLKKTSLDKYNLSVYPDYISSSILAYTGIQFFYSPQSNSYVSFIKWGEDRKKCNSVEEAFKLVQNWTYNIKSDMIFVTHEKLRVTTNVDLLFRTGPQIRDDETMYIYRINYK